MRAHEDQEEQIALEEEVEACEEATAELERRLASLKAFDAPRVEPAELAPVLEYGLAGKSSGVIAFTIDSVIADLGKIEAVKNVYCGRS